jgi:hypothetical protein
LETGFLVARVTLYYASINKRAPPSRARKPLPQSSALRLCRPPLRSALSSYVPRVGIPLGLALATSRLRQGARVHACTPNPKRPKHKIFRISLAWKVGSPFHPPPGVLLGTAEGIQAKQPGSG